MSMPSGAGKRVGPVGEIEHGGTSRQADAAIGYLWLEQVEYTAAFQEAQQELTDDGLPKSNRSA